MSARSRQGVVRQGSQPPRAPGVESQRPGEPTPSEARAWGGCGASQRLGEPARRQRRRLRPIGLWPSGLLALGAQFSVECPLDQFGRAEEREAGGGRQEGSSVEVEHCDSLPAAPPACCPSRLGPRPPRRTGRRGGCSNLCPLRGPPTACGEKVHHIDIGSGATVERVRSTARCAVAEVAAATASVRPSTVWYVWHPLG